RLIDQLRGPFRAAEAPDAQRQTAPPRLLDGGDPADDVAALAPRVQHATRPAGLERKRALPQRQDRLARLGQRRFTAGFEEALDSGPDRFRIAGRAALRRSSHRVDRTPLF